MAGEVPLEGYKKALGEAVKDKLIWSLTLHLLHYVVINLLFVMYEVLSGRDGWEYLFWVAMPWAVGLFCHYMSIYGNNRNFEKYEAVAGAMAGGTSPEDYKGAFGEAVRDAVRRSFTYHLLFYVMVNVSYTIFEILVAPQYLKYSLFVAVFWGLGLFLHYLNVRGINHNFGKYEAIAEARARGA